jgi:hypothetical protein
MAQLSPQWAIAQPEQSAIAAAAAAAVDQESAWQP